MDRLLIEYTERFKENFPTFYMLDFDEAKVEHIIRQCLEDGEPYKPDYSDKSVIY